MQVIRNAAPENNELALVMRELGRLLFKRRPEDMPGAWNGAMPGGLSPMPLGPSSSSVGNGPRPTRVVYALMTPMMRVRFRAGTPEPDQTPAVELFELVT